MLRITVAGALTGTLVLLGACGNQTQRTRHDQPAPRPRTAELAEAAGLELHTVEHLDYHVHAHLVVFVDGEPLEVPAAIGIVIDDPAVKEFPSEFGTDYGGIDGQPYEGNPADIELVDQREIAIVIGRPPADVPSEFDFSGV